MHCNNCGYLLEGGVKYCHNCGTPNPEMTGQGHPVKTHEFEKIIKENKIASVAVAILAAVALFFIAFGIVSALQGATAPVMSQSSDQSVASTTPASQQTNTGLTLSSISPTTVIAPYANLISLNGSGFEPGAHVQLGGKNMTISGDVTPGLVYINYQGNFSPGTYNLTIINPDGQSATLNQVLTIESSAQATGQTTPSELSSSQITAKISPAIVMIRTDLGCGSGMVVGSSGTILTDDHVISGAAYIDVYLNSGVSYTASVSDEDTAADLALIKINDTGLPTVTFGDSSDSSVNLGESVLAIGYPLTCNQNQTLEVDPGIVTARRTIPDFGELIQTSARINPGDSGGPLVDEYGNVIGINEAYESVLNIGINLTGIAFATPSDTLQSFVATGASAVNSSSSNSSQTPTTPPSQTSTNTPAPNTSQSDETAAENYYYANNTCIGLSGNQYDDCITYAINH